MRSDRRSVGAARLGSGSDPLHAAGRVPAAGNGVGAFERAVLKGIQRWLLCCPLKGNRQIM
jgi:hypothetical protein